MRLSPALSGLAVSAVLLGCNPDPGLPDEQVGYRDPTDDGATSGERGNIVISEVLWSGSVRDGERDQADVFIELRNEGARPVNLSRWQVQLDGTRAQTFLLPDGDFELEVGAHGFLAAKSSRCFPEPDWVVPGLNLPDGDPFRITLKDADERLIDGAGSRDEPVFAGGWDQVTSRSMERIELMFGGRGTEPHMWHYYTTSQAAVDVPNNDRIEPTCQEATLASPGRANSPDYSGAFASGGFE